MHQVSLCTSLAAVEDSREVSLCTSLAAVEDSREVSLCTSLAAVEDSREVSLCTSLAAVEDSREVSLCTSLAAVEDSREVSLCNLVPRPPPRLYLAAVEKSRGLGTRLSLCTSLLATVKDSWLLWKTVGTSLLAAMEYSM